MGPNAKLPDNAVIDISNTSKRTRNEGGSRLNYCTAIAFRLHTDAGFLAYEKHYILSIPQLTYPVDGKGRRTAA